MSPRRIVLGAAGAAGVAAVIEALSRTGLVDATALPPASTILREAGNLAVDREFLVDAGATLKAWLGGLALAVLVAVPLGVLLGSVPFLGTAARALVELMRPIPSVALIPLALLIYGYGFRMEIAVVAFACFWPLLIITESAVRGIEPRLIEVSRALGFGLTARVCKIVLPAALPRVFVGLRLAAAVSLVVAVTVEITANPIGLGYALIVAQESMKPDRMFVFLIWIGFLGWLVNAVLLRAQQRWFGRMGNWAEQAR